MKVLYRRVLELEQSNLVKHLEVNGEFVDELVSKFALDTFDSEILNHVCGNRERVKELLNILKTKDSEVYLHFKQCLKATKNDHVIHLLEKAEKSVQEEIEASAGKLRTLLFENFKESKSTSFLASTDIKDTLIDIYRINSSGNVQFADDIINDEFLKENIMSTFPHAKEGTYDRLKKRSGKKPKTGMKSSEHGFFGISQKLNERLVKQEQNTGNESENEVDFEKHHLKDDQDDVKIKMNVSELYDWLKCILESSFGDTSAADKFREQDIDGEVFDELLAKDKELEEYLPKYGQRMKVKMKWQQLKDLESDNFYNGQEADRQTQSLESKIFQTLRPFACVASFKHKYQREARVSKADFRKGSLLNTMHMYRNIEGEVIKSSKDLLYIAHETIRFGSACMNERINGTIHFGITGNSVIKGCIIKMDLNKVEREILKEIQYSFHESHVALALNCIKPAQFVETVQKSKQNEKYYIIEVDVLPSASLVESHAFFVKTKIESSIETMLFRYIGGEIKSVDHMQIEIFMTKERHDLSKQRVEEEKRSQISLREDKNTILQQFFCCGNDFLEPSIYLFLILGENTLFTPAHVEFLKLVKWNVIFDFTPKDETEGIQVFLEQEHGQAFNTNFIEDFDSRKSDDKKVLQTEETLKSSSLPNWIYCNGRTRDAIHDLPSWKLERCSSFRKAFEFYFSLYEEKRCKVFIPLFNSENTILQEATEEVFLKLRENCLVVAESESISCSFQEALQKRNLFTNPKDLDNYFLVGLPWSQVGEAVGRFVPNTQELESLQITRSSGVHAILPEKLKNELCDIEIVCANECHQIASMSDGEKERMETKVGESFYSGGLATWSNFYFHEQVLLRDVNTQLMKLTINGLNGPRCDASPVQKVIIYHQPGAGGSTTGRQILWNMKDRFRCCVVKTVTKQTCEQISVFRKHGETSHHDALPVLVLVDLDDEDAVARFYDDIVTEALKHSSELFCVLLLCCRVSELPSKRVHSKIFLKQLLSDREQQWFKNRYKHLEANHKKQKGCNPETLLSFNIMKENFSMSAIDKYVSKYVRDPNLSHQHRRFLKYLAFINHFDKDFRPIPVSCFDPIMEEVFWTNHMPQSTRVLVSSILVKGVSGHPYTVRIANYLLSLPVLHAVMEYEKEQGSFKETVGEVALEILKSKLIQTRSKTHDYRVFQDILSNIIKKRKFVYSGEIPKQFSLLIMSLINEKAFDQAIEIADLVFDITDDPYVAQQLARLHAHMDNWDEAHETIKQAMKILPDNHYLTHTCGHIYSLKFSKESKLFENGSDSGEELIKVLENAQMAMYYFKESQNLSRQENVVPQDTAGLEGEIRLSINILKIITIGAGINLCEDKQHAIQYIKDNTKCLCAFLNEIPVSTEAAIQTLEADIYAMIRDPFAPQSDFLQMLADGRLQEYKDTFYDLIQSNLDDNQDDVIRTFIDAAIADTKTLKEELQHLDSSLDLWKKVSARKMRSFVAVSLELILRQQQANVRNDLILTYSRQLLDQSVTASTILKLEASFMFTVLHWPLEEKWDKRPNICPVQVFIQNVKAWQKLSEDKPNKVKHSDKIICYLEDGNLFPFLVRAEDRHVSKLKVLKGNVSADGTEVEIMIHRYLTLRDMPVIKIPFVRPLKRSSLWNRVIEAVIGFGLHGPKAELKDDFSQQDMPEGATGIDSPRLDLSTNLAMQKSYKTGHSASSRSTGSRRGKRNKPIQRSSSLFTTQPTYLGPARSIGPVETQTPPTYLGPARNIRPSGTQTPLTYLGPARSMGPAGTNTNQRSLQARQSPNSVRSIDINSEFDHHFPPL